MSSAPFTLLQIQQRRQQRVDQLYNEVLQIIANRASSLSDPNGQTTTINLPLKPKIFTLVSWNVQTFFAGKSLSNPFVNKIINRVLEDLDADVCMLLETREESYLNMNAIENNLVGNKKWKMVAGEEDEDFNDEDDPPEEDDDEQELDDEDDDPLAADQEEFGGEPLRYLQIVSEMTGKKWRPPRRIYVYDKEKSERFRALSDIAYFRKCEAKKTALTAKEKKRQGQIQKRLDKNPKYYKQLSFDKVSSKEKGVSANAANNPKLFRNLCVNTDTGQPWNRWCALATEAANPFHRYYELRYIDANFDEQDWAGDLSTVSASDYWRFFFELADCAACKKGMGKGTCGVCEEFSPASVAFTNLRQIIDEITFYRCNCEESYSVLFRPDADVTASSSSGVWLKDKLVSVKSIAARLLLRAPGPGNNPKNLTVAHSAGDLLQFSDQSCGFAGRSPFLLPFEIWLPYHDQGKFLHSVSFHGPFGAATIPGIRLRAQAMEELLNGAVGTTGVALKDSPHALVIGDFNLNWTPDDKRPKGPETVAGELYDSFMSKGFKPMIQGGVATSLVSYHGKSKWKTISGGTTAFTSSAYDNAFLKSAEIEPYVVSACVIDVFDWLVAHLNEFPLPDDDPQKGKINTLSLTAQAFYIYHKYVSDHLPVLIDIMVAPMSEAAKSVHAKSAKQTAEREALLKSGKVTQMDVAVTFDKLLDITDPPGDTDLYNPINNNDVREATFCGTIDIHQDGHLIVVCRPEQTQQGQRIWIAVELPIANVRMRQRMMEGPFAPGKRIQFRVANPRPH